jgi:hypothetical protein
MKLFSDPTSVLLSCGYTDELDEPACQLVWVVAGAIIPAMSDPKVTAALPAPVPAAPRRASDDDKVICERCGAEMFRMHAVWRCPACRYKTDCCGW